MRNHKKQNIDYYLADIKIIKGLYLTIDPEKIKKNYEQFKINLSNSHSEILNKNNISILTICYGFNQFIQFQVNWNLNIKELYGLSNDFISTDIKSMILEAYKLTKMKTNNEIVLELTNECLT